MDAKPFWQSRTLWFNLLAIVVMLAQSLGFGEFEASPEATEFGTALVILVNLALRIITRQPLGRR